jgi:hypothetical protein
METVEYKNLYRDYALLYRMCEAFDVWDSLICLK